MTRRPFLALLDPVPAAFLSAFLAAAQVLPAQPLRTLTPGRFERSPLFREWQLARKQQLRDPVQPDSRATYYTFQPSPNFHDGLSVALRQRGTKHNATFETTHLVVYWKQEEDAGQALAGKRRAQVHRILETLELAGSEDRVVDALVGIARTRMDARAEVEVPAPHELTVFHNLKHGALGFEVRNQGEQP
jgi:hypothetical protein